MTPPDFRAVAEQYGMPVSSLDQRRRKVARVSRRRLKQAATSSQRRREQGEGRLAWLDSTFPWRASGFRYQEALAIHEARPDSLFFSEWELTDPFPAPVHPLAEFPAVAVEAGVTDAYATFELFLAGLLGTPVAPAGEGHPLMGSNLLRELRGAGIRLHGMLYPGGGMHDTAEGRRRTGRLVEQLDSAFSYVPSVIGRFPAVIAVPQALTDTRFYRWTETRWHSPTPLRCLFVADGTPRKGLDAALAAMRDLDPGEFQLDVVGPHEHRAPELPDGLARFHGWAAPDRLRELHERAHVVVSPVSVDALGVVDGFPTQAAGDAMSSGCLLVSANPARDHRILTPGAHYIECQPTAESVRSALIGVRGDLDAARSVARLGSERLRAACDIRLGVARKLALMGLDVPTGTPR